jgi:hypothetical protein
MPLSPVDPQHRHSIDLEGLLGCPTGSSAAPARSLRESQAGRQAQRNPTNHNLRFAPVIHPTLQTGVEALIVARRAWLVP